MPDCYKYISKDIGADCNALIQPGVEQKAVIINRADIDMTNVTYDVSNSKIITALPLLSTKKGFAAVVPGSTPFTGVGSELQVGTYVNTWNNTVPVVVFDNGPEVANKVIDPLANGEFVVVVENRHKGTLGASAFQVYGLKQGLRASAGSNDKYAEETNGGWLVTLTESRAPDSALFLGGASYSAIKALFDSLLVAAS